MKELLIVRSGTRYLRFRPEGVEMCEMNKASVFPLDQASRVRDLIRRVRQDGIADAELCKLTITEELYEEMP